MRSIACLLLALLLIALTQGCGSRSLQDVSGQGPQTETPPYPELLAALPELPVGAAGRQAAAAGLISRNGVDTVAHSANVTPDPPALVLTPGLGELSYALYEFPLANCTWDRSIDFDITIEAGEDVWLAWSNYADACWNFHQLTGGETSLELPPGGWLSPLGNFYFAVLAFDPSQARIVELSVPVFEYHWEVHVVEAGTPAAALSSSLAVVGGKPAVAYHSATAVSFARATSAAPTSMSDWVNMAVDSSSVYTQGGVSLAEIAGKPMIAYERVIEQLRFARALSANPISPLDWVAMDLTSIEFNYLGQLASVDGKPAVAWTSGLTTDLSPTPQLNYSYATVAEPGASDWADTEITQWVGADYGLAPTPPCLAELNAEPVVAYYLHDTSSEYYEGDTEDLWFTRALSVPPAGPADWPLSTIDSDSDVGRGTALAVVDGHVLLGYRDATNGLLKAAVGAEPLSGPADFEFYTVAAEEGGNPLLPAVAAVADRPAIAYWNGARQTLMLVWWQQLYPAATGDWAYFIVEEGLTDVDGVSLADLSGMPVLTYYDKDLNALKFARLTES